MEAQRNQEYDFDFPLSLSEHRKILVVEDDTDLQAVITHITKHIDPEIEIDWYTSAEDAVDSLRKNRGPVGGSPYDLMIADIFLEGAADGLDLWRFCEKTFPTMPILITSSLAVEKYFSSVSQNTVVPPFLPKPFSTRECYEAITGLLTIRH